jgi:hypothetical protein
MTQCKKKHANKDEREKRKHSNKKRVKEPGE